MAWLTGWNFRKEIRYGVTFPGSNLTDFPKLFDIVADADVAAALSGGGGITVTLADGQTEVSLGTYPETVLASGTILMRALFSPLTGASTGDVMGYLYYDSGETTTEDKAGVVSNGYVLFMDMEQDPSGSAPQMFDWVTETNLGTSVGSMGSGDLVSAEVGKGLDFDGVNDYISVPHSTPLNITGSLTLEGIIKPIGHPAAGYTPLISKEGVAQGYYFGTDPAGSDNLMYFGFNAGGNEISTASAVLSDNTFYHTAGVYNGSGLEIFVNGTSVKTGGSSTAPAANTNALFIGAISPAAPLASIQAVLDEIRVSSVARLVDWIAYTYQDEFNNDDTFTLGPQETEPVVGGGSKIAIFSSRTKTIGMGVTVG